MLIDPDVPPGRDETLADRAGLGDLLRTTFAALARPHDPQTGAVLPVTTVDRAAKGLADAFPGARTLIGFAADPALSPDAYRGAGFNRLLSGDCTGRLEELEKLPLGAEVLVDRVRLSADSQSRTEESLATALRFGGGQAWVWTEWDEGDRQIDGQRWAEQVIRDRPVLDDGTVLPEPAPRMFGPAYDTKAPERRAWRIEGRTWNRWLERTAAEQRADLPADGPPIVAELAAALDRLTGWGFGETLLSTPAKSLTKQEDRLATLAAAAEPGVRGLLMLFDAPLAGLPAEATERFLSLCRRLIEGGNTVVVAGSEPGLCEAADYLVELGQTENGEGGCVLFAGPPQQIAAASDSRIAPFLHFANDPPVAA
ncbi:MAG: hypothetical protein AAF907_16840, partial [Planctomycetota bacterium]